MLRGLDYAGAAYEWNYGKQLLAIRTAEASHDRLPDLYGDEFLIRRAARRAGRRTAARHLLVVDELDRADDEFRRSCSILGRLRDHDSEHWDRGGGTADRRVDLGPDPRSPRRAQASLFYHWIDYPSLEREIEILRLHTGTETQG